MRAESVDVLAEHFPIPAGGLLVERPVYLDQPPDKRQLAIVPRDFSFVEQSLHFPVDEPGQGTAQRPQSTLVEHTR